jgi:hypothetical protein
LNKIYAKIISNRVHKIDESILKEEQNGFRKGRSCINCFFTITQLKKRNEFNLPTYIVIIDYIKVFDMVNRNKLWQILALKGFAHLIQAIKSLYIETNIMIKNGGRRSQKRILINQGV